MKRACVCFLMVWACSCQPVADDPIDPIDPIDPMQGKFAVGPYGPEDNRPEIVNGRHFKPRGSASWRADATVIIKHYQLRFDIINGPLSVEEAGEELDEAARGRLPAGRTYRGPTWDRLKAEVEKGARLYFCKVGYENMVWPDYRGWIGYATVRGSKVTADLHTHKSGGGRPGMPFDDTDEFR